MEVVQKLKTDLMRAAINYAVLTYLAIRFGEVSWIAYLMRCTGVMGASAFVLATVIKRMEETSHAT